MREFVKMVRGRGEAADISMAASTRLGA